MSSCISVCNTASFCGEAPIWDAEQQRLFWVDTDNPTCFSLDVQDENREYATYGVNGKFQSIAKARISTQEKLENRFIASLHDRVVLCTKDFSIVKDLGNPLSGKPYMLLGDGTVGPDGCFYFGAFNSEDLYSKEGVILRVNRDLTIETAADGFALPNGLAFSSCGSMFYVTEMFANTIHAFDFSPSTSILQNRRTFARIPEEQGMPDGLIIDSEGFLWSAHWQGFRITRYDPDGTVERTISVPVPTPTCMAFGGRDLTSLYITTARKGLSDKQLKDYPESGNLFKAETEIQGREELVCTFSE